MSTCEAAAKDDPKNPAADADDSGGRKRKKPDNSGTESEHDDPAPAAAASANAKEGESENDKNWYVLETCVLRYGMLYALTFSLLGRCRKRIMANRKVRFL